MNNTALLIIDMINDFNFQHGPSLANKCYAIADNILYIKHFLKQHQAPIIYINDHYGIWQANMDKIIVNCKNELSSPIFSKIQPDDDDYFLIKPHYSAFYETPLNSLLGYLKIENVILTGIAGNICVLFTANDAHMRNYKLYVPKDCIASNDDKDNNHALTVMENVLKANIQDSSNIKSLFNHPSH
ncbi:isochorismatase family cysteine hydrolase [Bacillus sp. 165]|uniref:isochorismatase family cysteine hydrolase n=1 Tax=Bacillus sp. 165 TaxID=1529117 RepID=UPI001ADBDD83|nr:cysteine hydrolase [Bacillus sp. 165]